ncbi:MULTISPECIES: hypothetical protein [unclassified Leptolyngbya]|uniref:hypothetical protein n=1 Tax=unclassified Leptolyngbya TaxID=2650499 RepID=UPI0016851A83|nr:MULTISPECIES: hypothetical protein [unclassified Leptolyngbya]MBD1913620.1 hypothetical protein [Leptolyngbya sp. FACHB-8]MBD2154049.1 hypothetical protein [Leptolyngbya sp. FACHB-16]
MTLLRTPPEKVRALAYACVGIGFFLSAVNVYFTERYFAQQIQGTAGNAAYLGTWAISILIAVYESALISILLSPDELPLTFLPSQLEPPPGFPRWVPTAIKWVLLIGAFLLTWFIYRTDWISTTGALGIANPEPRRIATVALVFGGEISAVLAHLLHAIGKTGQLNTRVFWEGLRSAEKQTPAIAASNPAASPVSSKLRDTLKAKKK